MSRRFSTVFFVLVILASVLHVHSFAADDDGDDKTSESMAVNDSPSLAANTESTANESTSEPMTNASNVSMAVPVSTNLTDDSSSNSTLAGNTTSVEPTSSTGANATTVDNAPTDGNETLPSSAKSVLAAAGLLFLPVLSILV